MSQGLTSSLLRWNPHVPCYAARVGPEAGPRVCRGFTWLCFVPAPLLCRSAWVAEKRRAKGCCSRNNWTAEGRAGKGLAAAPRRAPVGPPPASRFGAGAGQRCQRAARRERPGLPRLPAVAERGGLFLAPLLQPKRTARWQRAAASQSAACGAPAPPGGSRHTEGVTRARKGSRPLAGQWGEERQAGPSGDQLQQQLPPPAPASSARAEQMGRLAEGSRRRQAREKPAWDFSHSPACRALSLNLRQGMLAHGQGKPAPTPTWQASHPLESDHPPCCRG